MAAMQTAPTSFWVADLNARGELQLLAEYRYEHLEQIPGAADLIAHFSTHLWRSPDTFEGPLALGAGQAARSDLAFRWRSSAPTAGVATLRWQQELISLSLLASGLEADADQITLQAFQQHLLRELRDTGFEPAFALMDLKQRPLVASFNFRAPPDPAAHAAAALADRSFAASYFRYLGLV